jgi:hypothetical protein
LQGHQLSLARACRAVPVLQDPDASPGSSSSSSSSGSSSSRGSGRQLDLRAAVQGVRDMAEFVVHKTNKGGKKVTAWAVCLGLYGAIAGGMSGWHACVGTVGIRRCLLGIVITSDTYLAGET